MSEDNPIDAVSPSDVLCGRGGDINRHEGNIQYRRLVASHRDEYARSTNYHKVEIAQAIVEQIRADRKGHFLKREETGNINSDGDFRNYRQRDGRNSRWLEIGEEEAVKKTCQALRENPGEAKRKRKRVKENSAGDCGGELLAEEMAHLHNLQSYVLEELSRSNCPTKPSWKEGSFSNTAKRTRTFATQGAGRGHFQEYSAPTVSIPSTEELEHESRLDMETIVPSFVTTSSREQV